MQQQVKERTERVTVSRETSTAIGTLEETVDEVQPTELESGGEFQFETVDELTFGNCDDSDFSDDDEYSSKAGVYRTMCREGFNEEWLLIKWLTIYWIFGLCFHKKNVNIFGPATQIFYLPQFFFSGPHFRHCVDTLSIITNHLISPFCQVLYIKI